MLFKNYVFGFVLVSLLLFSGCGGGGGSSGPVSSGGGGGGGYIQHTIYSPFDDILSEVSESYYEGITSSGTPTIRHAVSRYQDFAENYDTGELEAQPQPYCKIGGDYIIKIKNYAGAGGTYESDEISLFYCSTLADLLSNITIPSSWSSSDLSLYCNDGQIINFENINFDLLTSRINVYKGCILKNEDLESENTIFYGFEVGNTYLDDDPRYRFNPSDIDSSVTHELNNGQLINSETRTTTEERIGYIPRVACNECETCTTRVPKGEGSTCQEASYEWRTMGRDREEVLVCTPVTCDEVTPALESQYPGFIDSDLIDEDNGEGKAVYKVIVPVEYQVGDYQYQTNTDGSMNFHYDEYSSFFSLTDVDEALDYPITSVFPLPGDFGLSRVALFRQENNKKILGYEKNTREMFDDDSLSTKPVYIIDYGDFSLNQQDCTDQLASYGAKPAMSISNSDSVVCGNSMIFIHSENIDGQQGSYTAFNIFKNVILEILD